MRYLTAEAFREALEARLRATMVAEGQAALTRQRKFFVFDRLLARMLAVAPERFAVKGAVALSFRYGDRARITKDLDLSHLGGEGASTTDLISAQAADLGDYFELAIERTNALDDLIGGAAVRYRVRANLAGRRFEQVTLDVGFGKPTDLPPDFLVVPEYFAFAGIPPLELPVISIEQHVAEKLHAFVRIYSGGHQSSRVKDLVDLVLIRSHSSLEATRLRYALGQAFAARSTPIPFGLAPPPPEWRIPYEQLAGHVGLDPDIDSGFRLAAAFLDPILNGSAPDGARWNPQRGAWSAPDTPAEVP